jgi:hypothetical protein
LRLQEQLVERAGRDLHCIDAVGRVGEAMISGPQPREQGHVPLPAPPDEHAAGVELAAIARRLTAPPARMSSITGAKSRACAHAGRRCVRWSPGAVHRPCQPA